MDGEPVPFRTIPPKGSEIETDAAENQPQGTTKKDIAPAPKRMGRPPRGAPAPVPETKEPLSSGEILQKFANRPAERAPAEELTDSFLARNNMPGSYSKQSPTYKNTNAGSTGGYNKFNCNNYYTYNCQNWTWVRGSSCNDCVIKGIASSANTFSE